ncbi:MAG TPA: VWA-like domain-containing protein [Pseudoduganella sp.]
MNTIADEALSRCKLRLRQESPFFAVLSMFAGYRFDERIKLADTDGRDIYIHPDAFLALSEPARISLLLHLTLHAALLHPLRQRTRDPELWNIACDVMVNHIISSQTALSPPPGTIQARDLAPSLVPETAEHVYEWLQKNRVPASSVQPGGAGDISEDGNPAAAPSAGASPSRSGDARKSGMSAAFAKRFAGAAATSAASASAPELSVPTAPAQCLRDLRPSTGTANEATLHTHWEAALVQARQNVQAQQQGSDPGGLLREIQAAANPQLDWRTLLWRFMVRTPTDFAGLDRRFVHAGLYLEDLEQETVRLHVAIDTSGSIDDDTLRQIGAELTGILQLYPHMRCELYYCDTVVHGPHSLHAGLPLPDARGGGGTDFRPFFDTLERQQHQRPVDAAIYFTDGMGIFPDQPPTYPLLWVALPGAQSNESFPFGSVIRIN